MGQLQRMHICILRSEKKVSYFDVYRSGSSENLEVGGEHEVGAVELEAVLLGAGLHHLLGGQQRACSHPQIRINHRNILEFL